MKISKRMRSHPKPGRTGLRARLCGLLMILALALSSQAAQAQVAVDLALCIDGSGSISALDFELQRDAYIAALNTLVPRDGTVRLSIFQFSQTIITELSPLVIEDEADMTAVLAALTAMVQQGFVTNTEGCILQAADAIDGDEMQARKIIDMSTDGVPTWTENDDDCTALTLPNTCSDAAVQASDDIEAADIIDAFNVIAVGGLLPLDFMDDLPFPAPVGSPFGDYPDDGDPPDTDGFLVPVADFDAFETALELKLLLELSVTFNVTKSWVGGAAPGEVTIQLACDGTNVLIDGLASPQSKLTTGDVASFSISGTDVGQCTATELTDISDLWTVNDDDCFEVDPAVQTSCTITNVRNEQELTLVKTGSGPDSDYDAVGDILSYTFSVENTGAAPLAGPVTIDDNLTTDESCPAVSTVGNADGNLDPGETIVCTASHTVTEGDLVAGSVQNCATASADGTDSNEDCETLNAELAPGLNINKTGSFQDESGDGSAQAGETVFYTLTVTNTGNLTLTNILVSDPLVSPVTCLSGNPIPSLAPDAQEVCTGSYAVTQDDINSGSVFNLASACGAPPGGGELCDEDDHNEFLPLPDVGVPSMTTYGLLLLVLALMLAGLYGYRVRGQNRVT